MTSSRSNSICLGRSKCSKRALIRPASLLIFCTVMFILLNLVMEINYSNSSSREFQNFESLPICTAYNYTFKQADDYKGPILSDWPPQQSRNLHSYMTLDKLEILSDTSCLNLSDTRLLILIQTSPANVARRQDNRQTWMLFRRDFPKVKALFVLGLEAEKTNGTIDLEEEQAMHCDLLQFPYLDTYGNVTLDTMSAVQFSLLWNWTDSGPDFTVIMDDDNYVHLPTLWRMLFVDKIAQRNTKAVFGSVIKNARVQKPPKANVSSILYPPSYLYKAKTYPTYLNGNLYILPRITLPYIYVTAFHIPIFPINDIYVPGMLAEACQFPRKNIPGIHGYKYDRLARIKKDISFAFHYVNGGEKYALHKIFEEQNGDFTTRQPGRYIIQKNNIFLCSTPMKCDIIKP